MTPIERAAWALAGSGCCDADELSAHMKTVRTVLQAIREPSEGMVERAHAPDRFMMDATVVHIWRDMIDAALSE